MSKYERTLIDIARGIDDALADTGLAYRNRLGVRAMINDLVLALDGRAELKRLLGWFGAQGTVAEQAIVEHFGRRAPAR